MALRACEVLRQVVEEGKARSVDIHECPRLTLDALSIFSLSVCLGYPCVLPCMRQADTRVLTQRFWRPWSLGELSPQERNMSPAMSMTFKCQTALGQDSTCGACIECEWACGMMQKNGWTSSCQFVLGIWKSILKKELRIRVYENVPQSTLQAWSLGASLHSSIWLGCYRHLLWGVLPAPGRPHNRPVGMNGGQSLNVSDGGNETNSASRSANWQQMSKFWKGQDLCGPPESQGETRVLKISTFMESIWRGWCVGFLGQASRPPPPLVLLSDWQPTYDTGQHVQRASLFTTDCCEWSGVNPMKGSWNQKQWQGSVRLLGIDMLAHRWWR